MKLFSFFRSRDKPASGFRPQNALPGAYSFLFGGTAGGKTVNERTAMQTAAVYACVRVLAEAVAGLPLHVYRHRDGGGERIPEHPLFAVLHDAPNPETTSFVFRETLMSHLLLWGNAYAQIVRDGRGRVLSLWPLLPSKMTVDRADSGALVYTYSGEKGAVRLARGDVLHIPGLGFDGLVGYSPVAMAKNAVGMALATEEYGARFFSNGANPGGVLEHPGPVKDPARVRESWNGVYQGSGNAHRVAVLEEGMKLHAIGIPPEQAQFLETRKFQINEICRVFRVPPHLVGDLEKATFSNIEHQSLEFVKYTLGPWVARWEQSLGQALLLPSEKGTVFIKFNVDGLLRGDYASRMQGYAVGRQNGWLSANDVRDLEEMNRIPAEAGGDLYLVNGNMIPITEAKRGEKGNA
jgi:HK97 family phage portal protein